MTYRRLPLKSARGRAPARPRVGVRLLRADYVARRECRSGERRERDAGADQTGLRHSLTPFLGRNLDTRGGEPLPPVALTT